VDRIFHDEPSVRRLIASFPDRPRLRVCYEAGPTGYELARLLASMAWLRGGRAVTDSPRARITDQDRPS
jgi:hypothetical protein